MDVCAIVDHSRFKLWTRVPICNEILYSIILPYDTHHIIMLSYRQFITYILYIYNPLYSKLAKYTNKIVEEFFRLFFILLSLYIFLII